MDVWRLTNPGLPAAIDPAYERLLSALGDDDFGATVRGCVDAVTAGATRIYLFEAVAPDVDTLRYCHCEPQIAGQLDAYARHYKRLDPVRGLYGSAQRVGQMAMQRVRPADIASSAFRRRFFDQAGIVERISIVQRGADHWRGMNIARHARQGCFSARELDNLAGLARLALPMLSRARSRVPTGTALSAAQLEDRFAGRCAGLTRRERQVCACAAIGMSVEATAIELGIAKTSVLTFRQRAYRRLGVTSPFELLALVAR
jgi:DNA-binding CsgD family transcriptional regulator